MNQQLKNPKIIVTVKLLIVLTQKRKLSLDTLYNFTMTTLQTSLQTVVLIKLKKYRNYIST